MPRLPQLVDYRVLRPSETALALKVVTDLELLRLKTLARWYARGLLPVVTWEDLLQEALTRVLVGSRRAAADIPTVAFIAGVMRSLRSEYWRRIGSPKVGRRASKRGSDPARLPLERPDSIPGPEHALVAEQELRSIRRLFRHDPIALTIIHGLAEGLTAEEIRAASGLSETEYASARKRMRRLLLREGLTCEPK